MDSDKAAANKARQAKLLAKSKQRLEKITGAAKNEGRVISDGELASHPSSNPNHSSHFLPIAAVGIRTAPAPTPSTSTSLARAPPSTAISNSAATANDDDDPEEIDLGGPGQNEAELVMQRQRAQLQAAMGGFGGMGGGGGGGMFGAPSPGGIPGGGGGEDMFAQMMASLNAGGQSPFGGAQMPGDAPNPFAMGTGMGGPPLSPFVPAPRSLLDKLFPVVHLLSMIGLAIYVVGFLEPSRRIAAFGGSALDLEMGTAWSQWGTLLYSKGAEIADVVSFAFLPEERRLTTTANVIFYSSNNPVWQTAPLLAFHHRRTRPANDPNLPNSRTSTLLLVSSYLDLTSPMS